MMSWRSLGSLTPTKVILVPATRPVGFSIHLSSVGASQVRWAAFIGSEKAKPGTSADLVPNTPHKSGPVRLGPPLANAWQDLHCAVLPSPATGSPLLKGAGRAATSFCCSGVALAGAAALSTFRGADEGITGASSFLGPQPASSAAAALKARMFAATARMPSPRIPMSSPDRLDESLG